MYNCITMSEIHQMFQIHFFNVQEFKLIPCTSALKCLNTLFSYLYLSTKQQEKFCNALPTYASKPQLGIKSGRVFCVFTLQNEFSWRRWDCDETLMMKDVISPCKCMNPIISTPGRLQLFRNPITLQEHKTKGPLPLHCQNMQFSVIKNQQISLLLMAQKEVKSLQEHGQELKSLREFSH